MIIYDKKLMTDVNSVGGKGMGLAKLVLYGLPVPDFFVITANSDLSAPGFSNELKKNAELLNCDLFSVRSSGINEDGKENSFAGQYDTELNVKKENLLEAVKKVASSLTEERARSYANASGTVINDIAVVVQKQIRSTVSGVMFTTSPFSEEELIIESVNGSGELLVGGTTTPVHMVYKKKKEPDTADGYVKDLIKISEYLEKKEGMPMDVEWAFDGKLWILQLRPLTALGDKIPDLSDKKWNLYVYRNFCILCHSVQIKAINKKLQTKLFGFSVPVFESIILNGREFYTEENDRKVCDFWLGLGNEYLEIFSEKIKKSVIKTKRRTRELIKRDFSKLSDKELFRAFNKQINYYIESYVPLMMRPDEYLEKALYEKAREKDADIILKNIPLCVNTTMYGNENVEFLRSFLSNSPEKYLERYEWIFNPLAVYSRGMTIDDYKEKSKNLTKDAALQKIKEIYKKRTLDRVEANGILSGYSDDIKNLIELIKKFIFLRTYTSENSDRFFYYIKEKILKEIGKRKKMSMQLLLSMTVDEFVLLERGKSIPVKELRKRNSGELITVFNGEAKTFYSPTVNALLKKLQPETGITSGEKVYGEIACQGEAEGRVKVINSFCDVDKMEEGDIIVTSMTTPEISLALGKAAGIITDEGGITCHAAIIAREWGIPCLVGTRTATLRLTDGTFIKLDCLNGYFTAK